MRRVRAGGMQDESGFSLIELVVVILIVGLLAAIAIPTFLSQASKANDAAAKAQARTAQTAAEALAIENNGSFATLSVSAVQVGRADAARHDRRDARRRYPGSGQQGIHGHVALDGRQHVHDSPRLGRHRNTDMRPSAADRAGGLCGRKVVARFNRSSNRAKSHTRDSRYRECQTEPPGEGSRILAKCKYTNRSREDPCFPSFVVALRMRRVSP